MVSTLPKASKKRPPLTTIPFFAAEPKALKYVSGIAIAMSSAQTTNTTANTKGILCVTNRSTAAPTKAVSKYIFPNFCPRVSIAGFSVVADCTYPLTGVGCVSRIYTDLAVIDVTPTGLEVVEMVDGLALDELQRLTGVPLRRAAA